MVTMACLLLSRVIHNSHTYGFLNSSLRTLLVSCILCGLTYLLAHYLLQRSHPP